MAQAKQPAPPDPAPQPAPPEAQEAAQEASEQAQEGAQQEAARQGVTLSDQQLTRIGDHAAQEVFKLFERAGAFQKPEPTPPPAPEQPEEPEQIDAAPTKRTFAAKWMGGN